jgi:hypothetical protein
MLPANGSRQSFLPHAHGDHFETARVAIIPNARAA